MYILIVETLVENVSKTKACLGNLTFGQILVLDEEILVDAVVGLCPLIHRAASLTRLTSPAPRIALYDNLALLFGVLSIDIVAVGVEILRKFGVNVGCRLLIPQSVVGLRLAFVVYFEPIVAVLRTAGEVVEEDVCGTVVVAYHVNCPLEVEINQRVGLIAPILQIADDAYRRHRHCCGLCRRVRRSRRR